MRFSHSRRKQLAAHSIRRFLLTINVNLTSDRRGVNFALFERIWGILKGIKFTAFLYKYRRYCNYRKA